MSQLISTAQAIRTVEYTAQIEISAEPNYVRILKEKGVDVPERNQRQSAEVKYLSYGESYKLEVTHKLGDGELLGSITECWNGDLHQRRFNDMRRLYVWRQPKKKHEEEMEHRHWWLLRGKNAAFLPYTFLAENSNFNEKPYLVHTNQLFKPKIWEAVLKQGSFEDHIASSEKNNLLLRLKSISSEYEDCVTFDSSTKTNFPNGFVRTDARKVVRLSYTVNEFGDSPISESVIWRYPKRAALNWHGTGGDIERIDKLSLTSLKINSRNALDDCDSFTIDPSSVESIYDMDTQTLISVPK